jgi:16S rRNA (uracil1498-N3)-methyltransferase
VTEPQPLERVLASWPPERRLYWADESRAGSGTVWPGAAGEPSAILIGPEGGFSDEEKERLRGLPFVASVSLGPRILRAETAALAAVVQWQARFGDWR